MLKMPRRVYQQFDVCGSSFSVNISGLSIAASEAISFAMHNSKRTLPPHWLVVAFTMLAILTMFILAALVVDSPQ
jgi:hypothetical protein